MSGWKRLFGIDPVEATVWAVSSFLVVILSVEMTRNHSFGEVATLACLLAYAARRHFALKALPPEGETSGAWRLTEVEGRLAELEALHARVAELEERVDFNERLLAQGKDPVRVEAPR